jgi:outer membrane protein assembly factor BamB
LTGHVQWEIPEPGPVLGAPAYTDGVVVTSAGNAVEVVDARNGSVLYSFNSTAKFSGAPAIAEGRIFVGGILGGTGGVVYAFGIRGSGPQSVMDPIPSSPLGMGTSATTLLGRWNERTWPLTPVASAGSWELFSRIARTTE